MAKRKERNKRTAIFIALLFLGVIIVTAFYAGGGFGLFASDGRAYITDVDAPSSFNPAFRTVTVRVTIRNDGGSGNLFLNIYNLDTGQRRAGLGFWMATGETRIFSNNFEILQTTSFHGRVEAGHGLKDETQPVDDTYDFTISSTAPPGTSHTVTVTTNPTYCDVTLSGFTPRNSGSYGSVIFSNVASGTYTLNVEKVGYITKTQTVSVNSNVVFNVVLTIVQQPTYPLTIKTIPTSCDVTVQGETKYSGTAGAVFYVEDGTYSVTVAKSGYTTVTQSVMVSGSAVTRTINLASHKYDLTVFTIPGDCTVTVDGAGTQNSGSTGAVFVNLESGTYTITVSKDEYITKTEYATIVTQDVIKTIMLEAETPEPSPFEFDMTIILVIVILVVAVVIASVLIYKAKKRGKKKSK